MVRVRFSFDWAFVQMGMAMASRMLPMAVNLCTLLMLSFLVTPSEQGYYFTFTSFIALSVFADIGMGVVITQFVAHERAELQVTKDALSGPSEPRHRIGSLFRLAIKWYLIGGSILTVGIWLGGLWFFHLHPDPELSIPLAWTLTCVAILADISQMPFCACTMGLGFVSMTYSARLAKVVTAACVLWLLLLMKMKLLAIGFSVLAGDFVIYSILLVRFRKLFGVFLHDHQVFKINWHREVLPMQWRLAISWISGYFIFQLFVPLTLHFRGGIEAGQLGATLGLTQAVLGLSAAIVESQLPKYGVYIATKSWSKLNRFALLVSGISVSIALLCSLAGIGLLEIFRYLHLRLGDRFLSLVPMSIFFGAALSNAVINAIAGYLRAHKREPFLVLSVANAAIQTPLCIWACKNWGAEGMGWVYLLLSAGFSGVAWMVAQQCQRRWHAV